MNNSKKIYVYDCFSSSNPMILGYLYIDIIRGEESYSFEYDNEWLRQNTNTPILDPNLSLFPGRHYSNNKHIFGMFSDASPDRWGRVLMNKRERIRAKALNLKPKALYDSDYLLGVDDLTRMGGLRFKLNPDDEFLSNDSLNSIPPWTSLRSLEEASRNYENNSQTEKWIRQLLSPGSSLGGARPKASVIDLNGDLWIAKFPSKNDEFNVGAWEKVASDLARLCNINVPESKLENFSPYGSTFIVKRFDRLKAQRIHFASAMTLLNKLDGDDKTTGVSYLDIAAFIKSYGCNPKEDLNELWKRIVFSMAISNIDDHLRNHAFIYTKKGWKLSPMYDVNPVPYGNELSLNVDEFNSEINFDLALSVSKQFMIEESVGKEIINQISTIIKNNWITLAEKYHINNEEIEQMKPAFNILN